MKDLEICPFCKNRYALLRQKDDRDPYWIVCQTCGARGSEHPDRQDAINEWNEVSNAVMDYVLVSLK